MSCYVILWFGRILKYIRSMRFMQKVVRTCHPFPFGNYCYFYGIT
ncbi:hypothetical protein [Rubritalea tangerina]